MSGDRPRSHRSSCSPRPFGAAARARPDEVVDLVLHPSDGASADPHRPWEESTHHESIIAERDRPVRSITAGNRRSFLAIMPPSEPERLRRRRSPHRGRPPAHAVPRALHRRQLVQTPPRRGQARHSRDPLRDDRSPPVGSTRPARPAVPAEPSPRIPPTHSPVRCASASSAVAHHAHVSGAETLSRQAPIAPTPRSASATTHSTG